METTALPRCVREAKKSRGKNWILESLLALAVMAVASMPVSIVSTVYLFISAMPMMMEMIGSGSSFFEIYNAVRTYAVSADSTAFLIMLIGEIFLIAGVLIFCLLIEKRTPRGTGLSPRRCIPKYLLGWVLGAAMMALIAAMCTISGDIRFVPVSEIRFGMILLFLLGYTIQGAAEEFLSRGQHMLGLTRRYGLATAVLLSSILFGLLHVFNSHFSLLAMINITLSGICFALITLITDSIFCACAMHTAWNFLQGNVFGFSVSGNPLSPSVLNVTLTAGRGALWTGGAFGPEAGLAATVVLLLTALVLFLIFSLKTRRQDNVSAQ